MNTNKKIILVLALLFVVAFGNVLFLYVIQKKLSEKLRQVGHTNQVIYQTEILFGSLKDIETGQRGYLLTEDSKYLVPFEKGLTVARQKYNQLKQLTSNNHSQQIRLEQLNNLMNLKISELKETIELTKKNQKEKALKIVREDIGQGYMDSMRSIIKDFINEEQLLLVKRDAVFQNYKHLVNLLVGVEIALFVFGALITFIFLRRWLITPLEMQTKDLTTAREKVAEKNIALIKSKQKLIKVQQEVVLKNKELCEAEKTIFRSNEELDEFSELAAHDLKEPLRGISYCSDLLKEDYYDKLDKQAKSYLDKIKELAIYTYSLVNGFYEYLTITRADCLLEEADIKNIMHEVLMSLDSLIKAKNATIEINTSLPSIKCVPSFMSSIFLNIISNALIYNQSSKPKVAVKYHFDNDFHVFYISDNGIGIRDEDLKKVFHFMRRINAKDEFEKGMGKGMLFVEKMIKKQGGTIWIDSQVNVGTKVCFTIKNIVESSDS